MKIHWANLVPTASLGLARCPFGGDRLNAEIVSLKDQGVSLVVSLLTPEKSDQFGLSQEADLCRQHGIRFISLPIMNHDILRNLTAAVQNVTAIKSALEGGQNCVVHCYMGVGRSGIVASMVATLLGYLPDEAFALLTQARGQTIPLHDRQEKWLLEAFMGA